MRFIISAVSILLTVASAKGQTDIHATPPKSVMNALPDLNEIYSQNTATTQWDAPGFLDGKNESTPELKVPKEKLQLDVPFYMDPSTPQNNFDQRMFKFGGDSSGGGNSVSVQGRPFRMLLDFYATHRAGQIELRAGSLAIASVRQNAYRSENLPLFIPSEQPAYEVVRLRLEKWAVAFPELVQTFQQISRDMFFYLDDGDVPSETRYWISVSPEIRSQLDIKTVASYRRSLRGAVISRHTWNQMDLNSQAGLLLHETLRHVQIVEESSGSSKSLSDRALQEMVTVIMLDEPTDGSVKIVLQKISQSSFLTAKHVFFSPEQRRSRLRAYCANQSQIAQQIQIPNWNSSCLREGQSELEFYREQSMSYYNGLSQIIKTLSPEERTTALRFESYLRKNYLGFKALEKTARTPDTTFISLFGF